MTLNDREILKHAGNILEKLAKELAKSEYEEYRLKMIDINPHRPFVGRHI